MIDGKKIIAIIPARGGSKGIPRKNIKMIAGKPLLAWTIEEGKKSKYIDYLITSTDDNEIRSIAQSHGCDVPFLRPKEIALDDTPGIEVVIHALASLPQKYDYVVLLQPTSPLRTVEDIDGCIRKCTKLNVPACVSVVAPDKNPYWMYKVDPRGRLVALFSDIEQITRRQDLPTIYALNGAVYVAKIECILKTKSFLTVETTGWMMDKKSSIDIDSELDFDICEFLLNQRKQHA